MDQSKMNSRSADSAVSFTSTVPQESMTTQKPWSTSLSIPRVLLLMIGGSCRIRDQAA